MNNLTTPALNIYTDGGARGNPGPSAIGVVIKNQDNQIIHKFGRTIQNGTNNIAEYQAVIKALDYLIQHKSKFNHIKICHFFLDSSLVVNQLNGLWKVKNANIRNQIIKIRESEAQLNFTITYAFIPREKNAEADNLLNQALDFSSFRTKQEI